MENQTEELEPGTKNIGSSNVKCLYTQILIGNNIYKYVYIHLVERDTTMLMHYHKLMLDILPGRVEHSEFMNLNYGLRR